jgi:molybdopterin molybdotransferase
LKPGKPVGLGDIDACPVLALPGNPVAALVTFIALGRTVVLRLAGGLDEPPLSLRLPVGSAWTKRPARREYLFATVTRREADDSSVVAPVAKQGAAMLSSVTNAQGFIILDEATARVSPGQVVEFVPLEPLVS